MRDKKDMWELERTNPRLMSAAYAIVFVLSIIASLCYPLGFSQ